MGDRVEVKFNKDFVSSRGQSISGRKGVVKMYPMTSDLERLFENETLEKIKIHKAPKAARREKAAGPKAGSETS